MTEAEPPRVYFPGLNGIRAIAACAVMVSHVLQDLNHFQGHDKATGSDLANHAVIMFFTLSGFLITFLLLQEKERFGRIDFKAFYLRRILRIWPLYFLYLALALGFHWAFGPRGAENAEYVLLFIFFLPNIAFNLNRYPPDTAPLWSIGIEEQFYLVWPLVVSRIRALKTFLCILIVVLVGARASLHAFSGGGKHLATSITDSLGYDSMAVGALLAILYRDGHATLLRVARSWVPHLAFVALVIGLAVNKLRFFSQAGTLVTAVVTGVFIVSQIAGSRKPLDLEQPILNYLGKISFGIYVYHMLVITLVAKLLVTAFPDAVIPTPAIMAIVVASTIAIAGLSYRFFESPFLRFKHSLERVKTSARVP